MALFGAIIAVGLGPAMWVGAQFGTAVDVPTRPPAVTSQHGTQAKIQDKGGEAGSAPDTSVVIRTTPEAVTKPLSPVKRRPGASRTSTPPASPAPSSASPSPSSDQSSAPAQGGQSTPPDGGGTGDGADQPPSPPADQHPGGGGSGSGGTGDGQPVAS
jgi:hypothetical protein